MASRSMQFFMTLEEYWGTIWEVVSDRFTVVQEDLKTRDGVQIEVGGLPDDWKRGVDLVFPVAVQPSEFKVALRAPAKVGGIVLWRPSMLNDALIAGGIGIKNHWYEGGTCYEKEEALDDYKLFHRPLNKLIVGWTEII